MSGSPPRAWGRRRDWLRSMTQTTVHPHVRGDDEGSPAARLSTCPVHPHVRGDDGSTPETGDRRTSGSPPRAWGRPPDAIRQARSRRFTPTCVGTTAPTCARGSPTPVHPHVRGDDSMATSSDSTSRGSPPRAWGRPRWPARRSGCSTVHPHVRGDDALRARPCVVPSGSPPRAWGRRSGSPCPRGAATVHPHVRGDDCRAHQVCA